MFRFGPESINNTTKYIFPLGVGWLEGYVLDENTQTQSRCEEHYTTI